MSIKKNEEKQNTIEELKRAFKKVSDILSPFQQHGEILEYERLLLDDYEKLLSLKEEMYKIQKNMSTNSFKLKAAEFKYMEYLKHESSKKE